MSKAAINPCAAKWQRMNKIYLVGGYHSQQSFETGIQVYAISSGEFLAPITRQLAVGRSFLACIVLEEDGLLIAAGGISNPWKYVDSVEILDISSETWSSAGLMPEGKMVWTASSEYIFLKGLSSFYQYEPRRDRWFEVEDVPFTLTDLVPDSKVLDARMDKPCRFM